MKITYWSDYACPFCYIGETHLKKAIRNLGLTDVEIEMKAFELDPSASHMVQGPTVDRFAVKYGLTKEMAAQHIDGISEMGREAGLDFRYAETQYTNTFDAHRLTKLAQAGGDAELTDRLTERLYKAYFTDSLQLADHDVLKKIAAGSDKVMIVQTEVKGYFAENSFFYIDDRTGHGFLIDPGAEAERLLAIVRRQKWVIEKILLTHGHFDHTGAVNEIRRVLSIPVYAYETADTYLLDTRMNLSALCGEHVIVRDVSYLKDGDIVSLESDPSFRLKVFYTPGHTPDSVVYYSERGRAAFVGDTIFQGSIGNWQYPGGDFQDLQNSILQRIFTLPEDTKLYSGHSDPTTVGIEKRRYNIR